jgi:predicted Rossmann fold nucleotide-binding protein DprA/Smf involved in DNA uptake
MSELHSAYVYSLAHLLHLGSRSALKIKRLFPTYDSWRQASLSERSKLVEETLGSKYSSLITTNWNEVLDQAVNDVERHNALDIVTLTIDDEDYPALLRLIPDPPLVLFLKGSRKSLTERTNVAVVGTRNSTSKGEDVATRVAKYFGSNQFGIVSGLAKGIDSAIEERLKRMPPILPYLQRPSIKCTQRRTGRSPNPYSK